MPLPLSHVVVQPRRVIQVLTAIALVLFLANVCGLLVAYFTGHDTVFGVVPFFDFGTEHNLPSFFSACLLLGGAVLFFLVSRARLQPIWLFLAGIFVFLSFDELFEVHEGLIQPIRERFHLAGFLYFAWVIVYGAAVLLLAAAFVGVWWRLPKRIRWWLGVSAATYLTGAIGFEMLGAKRFEAMQLAPQVRFDLVYGVLYTIEEALEMAGSIMLIYGLLLLLQSEHEGFAVVIPGNQAV
jgi:hypothetical protein